MKKQKILLIFLFSFFFLLITPSIVLASQNQGGGITSQVFDDYVKIDSYNDVKIENNQLLLNYTNNETWNPSNADEWTENTTHYDGLWANWWVDSNKVTTSSEYYTIFEKDDPRFPDGSYAYRFQITSTFETFSVWLYSLAANPTHPSLVNITGMDTIEWWFYCSISDDDLANSTPLYMNSIRLYDYDGDTFEHPVNQLLKNGWNYYSFNIDDFVDLNVDVIGFGLGNGTLNRSVIYGMEWTFNTEPFDYLVKPTNYNIRFDYLHFTKYTRNYNTTGDATFTISQSDIAGSTPIGSWDSLYVNGENLDDANVYVRSVGSPTWIQVSNIDENGNNLLYLGLSQTSDLEVKIILNGDKTDSPKINMISVSYSYLRALPTQQDWVMWTIVTISWSASLGGAIGITYWISRKRN